MPLSEAKFAYRECFDLMDRALEAKKGLAIQLENRSAAMLMRMRLNQARKIDRRENARLYEEGHPMHGNSAYDPLTFRLQGSTVIIDKTPIHILSVEEIE